MYQLGHSLPCRPAAGQAMRGKVSSTPGLLERGACVRMPPEHFVFRRLRNPLPPIMYQQLVSW